MAPRARRLSPGSSDFTPTVSQATDRSKVVGIASTGCELEAGTGCQHLTVRLDTGPEQNVLAQDELIPDVDVGDQIRVQRRAVT